MMQVRIRCPQWSWLQVLVLLLMALAVLPAQAARAPTATELLDWAEAQFSSQFPGHRANQFAAAYTYRYYPETGNYVGVAGTSIWILGPVAGSNTAPVYVGELEAFACQVVPASCVATTFPSKGIRLVIPAKPGSDLDRLGQDLAVAMQAALRQPVTVSIVAGGSGTLGAMNVLAAPADGYTVLLQDMAMSTFSTLFSRPPFNPLTDFDTIGLIAESPMVLAAAPRVLANSVSDLVSWLLANAEATAIGHAGTGSPSFLCGLLLANALRISPSQVPQKSPQDLLTALQGNGVDLACEQLLSIGPVAKAGQVKAFGTMSAARTTIDSYGFLPALADSNSSGIIVTNWYGLYARRGTPPEVIERLNAALAAARTSTDFVRRQNAAALEVISDERRSPAQHRSFLAAEAARWGALIQASGESID